MSIISDFGYTKDKESRFGIGPRMETHHLGRHCRLVTEDHDEARDPVSAPGGNHRDTPLDHRDCIRWHQANVAVAGIADGDRPCAVPPSCGGPLSDSVDILFDPEGGIELRIDVISARSAPDRGVRHAPDPNREGMGEPCRLVTLTFDGAFVRAELERRFGGVPPLETWARDVPGGSPAVATLKRFCIWMAAEMDRADSPLASTPRVQVTIEKTLLSLFVECLAERLPGAPAESHNLADTQVRAIETWIEANLGQPIGIDDLAAVVGFSPRSVQKAFRRLRGCSPMTWVTRRRLARARGLLDHAGDTTTVTDVALNCGFSQLGRFAVRYREAFDEKPSETLARARRTAMKCVQNERGLRSNTG
jgi:AraC-like DNA-binding protein